MNKINLTEIALKNRPILLFLMISVLIGGIFSYMSLGRMENPDFTIRQMIVSVSWPGATAKQMQDLVLDKLERKLQETPRLDKLKTYARPGEAVIFVNLQDTFPPDEVRPIWQDVRNLANEAAFDLPEGVYGPFFDDRFDDVFGSIYAIAGDAFSMEEKRVAAEMVRRRFLPLESVKRVELLGVQKEKIYLKIDMEKIAHIGISPEQAGNALMSQIAIVPAGVINNDNDRIFIRFEGSTQSLEMLRDIPVNIAGRTLRLRDIADIERGYSDPMEPAMYLDGKQVIGLAVSMAKGHNIVSMGKELNRIIEDVNAHLPAGMTLEEVADQPSIVKESVSEFFSSLVEAVIIILIVSFLSLGFRTGLVVSLCIPLVFAGVFVVMKVMGIELHLVSLGTLIIALGLLVDDEIIAVEMMSVKLEEGMDRFNAACSAYRITALPMLSGTLITCAGFIPIGFSRGGTAEFTSSIFPVLVASLAISWIVSVTVAPYLGYKLIKEKKKEDQYNNKFYSVFRRFLIWSIRHKTAVCLFTAGTFFLSVYGVRYIQKEFFPPSKRGDLVIDLRLPENASIKATEDMAEKLSDFLQQQDGMVNYSYYVGSSAPRYVTTAEPVLPSPNYAQFIVLAKDEKTRKKLQVILEDKLDRDFNYVRSNVQVIAMGPPSQYPVMLEIRGENTEKVRLIAYEIMDVMQKDGNYYNINMNWNEKGRSIIIDLDRDRAVSMGIDRYSAARGLYSKLSGTRIGEYYEGDRIIDVIFKMPDRDVSNLRDIPMSLPNGQHAPLSHMAGFKYSFEDMSVWRKNLVPAVIVQAGIKHGTANDETARVYNLIKEIRDNLDYGYTVEVEGNLKDSAKSSKYLLEQIPLMFFVIITILMFQLKKFSLMFLALLTAPLGFIGVSSSMLLFGQPMGFMAQLGIIALSGMIIRNSVILLDQIEKNIAAGVAPVQALINASVMRYRPIMLTTVTAVLALIPLMLSNFWGPLAVSISGGLLLGTVLTLVVLPCMYALVYKIKN